MASDKNLPVLKNEDDKPVKVEVNSTSPLTRILELENKRIEVEREKIEIVKKAIDAGIKSDQNQFEFHIKRLEASERTENRNNRRYFRTLWIMGSVFIVFLGFFTYMAFFGEGDQAETALAFLKHLASAIAGYGIISWLISFIKKSQE